MNVLVTHECSGRVSGEFRKLGHNAYSCDLKPSEVHCDHRHIIGDAVVAIRRGCERITLNGTVEYVPWDLVICHPVCRFLANSGALRLYLGGKKVNGPDLDRWASMRDGAEDFRRLFFIGEYRGPLCVENSVMHGYARDIIEGPGGMEGVTRQIIQPFNFKENASKATVLWLRGLPPLVPTGYFPPRIVNGKKRWGNQTDSGQNKLAPARTYPGIAKAMAEQWGRLTAP